MARFSPPRWEWPASKDAIAPPSSRRFVARYVGDACARRRAADTYLSMTYGSESMTARFFAFPARPAALLLMGLMFAANPVSSALAQQACQEDFQRLTQKRMAQIGVLNRLGKAGKGHMDPIAACPAARALVGVETEMLNYMTKNKDWCSIPDNVIDGFKAARAKSQGFAGQACSVAAKVKQMQAQQRSQAAAGPANQPLKLPAGPL
jgi:hypothetical protein